ncbi:MAG: 1-deoxy-D-xylulose-5-phosphate synthase [Lentimicrobiaceae bacterium]|nr:1-deoxy-D-xylulose-5-phosphate synthase [Lentimicrobiaceae bacterium]
MNTNISLLQTIKNPEQLRQLSTDDLPLLCKEIRDYILETISKHPGHLGAALGVVELTVAIHYAFNTPDDKLVWDVGHQAYAHKILTERFEEFKTNRQYKGISGFPRCCESVYDCFGTGHSSTSISAVLGMAIANQLSNNTERQHIAVIGDGAMTGGMAMEALNHAGATNTNILVILNDNGIAIDKNEGALSKYLTHITTSKWYNRLKDSVWSIMGGNKKYGKHSREIVRQIGGGLKSTLLRRSNLFEAFGMRYFGPVDGHDVEHLVNLFNDIKKIQGPKLLHVITRKGKGFEQAEKQQTLFHAPGKFDVETGMVENSDADNLPPKYQDVFGETILELAKQNDKIVGITPAMLSGSSLNIMMEAMPHRTFDVGIAEQHAVTLAAGFAKSGYIPFCNIYSTFMQRAYDQVIHDVALQNLNVVFCLDRAGIVGEDGATHHGVFDLAYFRPIPNVTIFSPLNEMELRNMMFTAQLNTHKGPIVIRYPRGRGESLDWRKPFETIEIGKGQELIRGENIAFITIGPIGNRVVEAASDLKNNHGINVGVYDMRFLKPIDEQLLHSVFKNYNTIITVEDGILIGGLAGAIAEFAQKNNYKEVKTHFMGIPDRFIEHGSISQLHAECCIDKQSIVELVISHF